MVHVVKKKKGKHTYLALQEVRHVKYLGREDKFTKEQLAEIIAEYKKKKKKS